MNSLRIVAKAPDSRPGRLVRFPETRVFDADTGEEVRFMDLELIVEEGLWVARITVPISELDINAHLGKRTVRCIRCKREEKTND